MYGLNNILSTVSTTLTPPESLTGYGDVYIVTDLRKRGKKEPNDTKAYSKGFEWRKDKHNSYGNFTRDIFDLTKNKASYEKGNAVKNTDYVHIYARYNDGFLETPLQMFIPETLKGNEFRGYEDNMYTRIDKNKVFNYLDDYPKLEGFITKEYYKDLFNQNIDYQIGLMNNRIKNYPQYKNESEKELKYFKLLYSNPTKYQLFSKTSGLNVTEKYRPEILENSNLIDAPVKTESPAPETKKAQESAPVESTEPTPAPEKAQKSAPVESAKNNPGIKLMRDVYKEPEDVLLIREIYKEKQPKTVKRVTAPLKNKSEIDKLLNETVWNMSRSESSNWSFIPPYYQMIKDADIIYNAAAKYLENHNYISIPYFQNKYSDFYYDRKGVLNDINDIMNVNFADMSTAELRRILKKIKNRVSKINAFTEQFVNGGYFEPKKEGLGKPTIKFEFNNNDELKAFLNDNKENLIDSYIDADIADESPLNAKKALNGMPSADVFNCPESALYCGGLRPTYQRLNDYSHLIDTAENNSVLCGYGFADTTLKTLVNACKYYNQVERLAKHLAAATPLQTAFNIWHWEHTNLRYNYDTPGREEIRTPARTWLDRKSGIDCDCLAVFTAALLLNLGYKPKFEIVAFYNKKEYSHIFVNLDGIAIDRVLPMFNRRPVMICKTLLMEIPVYQLNGLSGDAAINTALHGVYENALKRYTHTLSESDKTDMRKTQILVTLQGCDYNAFRLAGLIMPYVAYIDDAGAYYFNNPDIAKIAANADKQLHDMELRGCSESELNGLFKSIGKAIKKAAQATGKAVASVAKATANTVKAAAESTVNAVKATGNLVKAGAQAITGHGSDAKETLKKAGEQLKDAIVDPVKQAATDTKNIVVDTVVNPTKTAVQITVDSVKDTVKIAGKVFKVIFVKINPITVLMRNALRMLVAINFLGMASRANVANMTLADAQKQGYSMDAWLDAKTAKGKIVRFFTKMGGKAENIEKAIVNGSKKKPLFKKDYKPESKIVESGEDDATLSGLGIVKCGIDGLGDGGLTIGSALAAVGAFIARIWRWLKNVFTNVAQNETVRSAAGELLETAKDAALERAKSEIQNKINPDGNKKGTGLLVDETTDGTTTDTTTTGNGKKAALIALLVTAGIAATAVAFGGKKKKYKRD